MLMFTDKQFANMEIIIGEKSLEEKEMNQFNCIVLINKGVTENHYLKSVTKKS